MDVQEALASRRMCRDYLADPVAPAVLERVVGAALRGPSAGNTTALDLVVLQGDAVRQYWDLTLPCERRDSFAWPGLLHAPVLVVVLTEPDAYLQRYAESDKEHSGLGGELDAWPVPYWWVDGGAAVMALLLAAEAEGLGALLFGLFSHEAAVLDAFGVPRGRRAVGVVALGHPRPGGHSRSASAARGRPEPAVRVHHQRW